MSCKNNCPECKCQSNADVNTIKHNESESSHIPPSLPDITAYFPYMNDAEMKECREIDYDGDPEYDYIKALNQFRDKLVSKYGALPEGLPVGTNGIHYSDFVNPCNYAEYPICYPEPKTFVDSSTLSNAVKNAKAYFFNNLPLAKEPLMTSRVISSESAFKIIADATQAREEIMSGKAFTEENAANLQRVLTEEEILSIIEGLPISENIKEKVGKDGVTLLESISSLVKYAKVAESLKQTNNV